MHFVFNLNVIIKLLEDFLEFITGILLLIFLAYALAMRQRRYVPRSLSEFKLNSKISPHRLLLPDILKYEQGYIYFSKVTGLPHVAGEEIKTTWKSVRRSYENSSIDLYELCKSPPLIVKSNGMLQAVLPAVVVKSSGYRGIVIACFNTKELYAKGTIYDIYENGFAKGQMEISGGVIEVFLEHYEIAVDGKKKQSSRVELELCSNGMIKSCVKLLRISGNVARELRYTYPLVKTVLIGYRNGAGFEELYKLLDQVPVVIGAGLTLRLTTRRGLIGKRVVVSKLEYPG